MEQIVETNSITAFTGGYDFLSNSFPCSVEIDGLKFNSAEAAFWAQRVKDVNARRKCARLNPNKAREKAMNAVPIDDWDELKEDIMKKILKIKFSNPDLKKKLKDTKKLKLLNNTTYRDEYWGIHLGKGKNKLGVLLMELRDEL